MPVDLAAMEGEGLRSSAVTWGDASFLCNPTKQPTFKENTFQGL